MKDKDGPMIVNLDDVTEWCPKGSKIRYLIEIRPIYLKNGRCGITFKANEAEVDC